MKKIMIGLLTLSSISAFASVDFEKTQSLLKKFSELKTNCSVKVGAVENIGRGKIIPLTIDGKKFDLNSNYLSYAYEQDDGSVSFIKFGKQPSYIHDDYLLVTLTLNRSGTPIDLAASRADSDRDESTHKNATCGLKL